MFWSPDVDGRSLEGVREMRLRVLGVRKLEVDGVPVLVPDEVGMFIVHFVHDEVGHLTFGRIVPRHQTVL